MNVAQVIQITGVCLHMKSRCVVVFSQMFILDKQKSDLCVDGQYHSEYQTAKHPSNGNVMALTKQTVGKCTWEQMFIK